MNQSGFVLPYSHGIVIGLEAILIKSRAKNDSWWRLSYLIDLDRDRRGSRRRSNGHSINSNQILIQRPSPGVKMQKRTCHSRAPPWEYAGASASAPRCTAAAARRPCSFLSPESRSKIGSASAHTPTLARPTRLRIRRRGQAHLALEPKQARQGKAN